MKRIISIAIVSLMAFSLAFGASAVVKESGNTASGSGGSATVTTATATASATVQAPDSAVVDKGEGTDATPATASGVIARDGTGATPATDADKAAETVMTTTTDDLKRTVDATDGTAVATNEEIGTDELVYATGIGEKAQDHTLLYALSIAGAVLLVGIPVTMKIMKKAD